MEKTQNKRITYISLLQAFAILCVIIGHVTRIYYYPGGWYYHTPEIQSWFFNVVTKAIYTFHMPIFIFISGYLCERTLSKNPSIKLFIKRRFKRLFIPFWLWGLLFSVPIWLYLRFPDANYKTFITGQVMGHLWFLPLLLEITLIYLLLRKLPKFLDIPLFIGLFFLQLLHIKGHDYFSVLRISEFMFYYFMGAKFFFVENSKFFQNKTNNYLLTVSSLLGFLFIEYILYCHNFRGSLRLALSGMLGVIGFVMLSKIMSEKWSDFIDNNKIIQFLSINLFYIYLIHEPIMEIILKYLGWGDAYRPLITVLSLFCGTMLITYIIVILINRVKVRINKQKLFKKGIL